jgi:hypothetical protein
MSDVHALRQLAERLDRAAERLREVADRPARGIAAAAWECARGRRALQHAEQLGAAARGDADVLEGAAHELKRAVDHG